MATKKVKEHNLSNGLIDFMARKDLNGSQLADILGVTKGTVSLYRSGKAIPSYSVMKTLIGLGMTLEEMFGEDMARKAVQDYTQEQARKDPVSTAHQAKAVLELLLEQVSKIGQA